jgi:hypothetical protein
MLPRREDHPRPGMRLVAESIDIPSLVSATTSNSRPPSTWNG